MEKTLMDKLSRRTMLKGALSGVAVASVPSMSWSQQAAAPVQRKGRIKQSVSRWCYKQIPLDQLCAYAAQIGLKGVDLLNPDEYEVPKRYGLVCSMAYAGGGELPNALNRTENHAKIEEGYRKYIPLAAKAGVPNVITFSGNRNGMSDEEGTENTIAGLNRVKKIAEDNGVTSAWNCSTARSITRTTCATTRPGASRWCKRWGRRASSCCTTSITCRSWRAT